MPHIRTALAEEAINLMEVGAELRRLEQDIELARDKHNAFLKELGLPGLP